MVSGGGRISLVSTKGGTGKTLFSQREVVLMPDSRVDEEEYCLGEGIPVLRIIFLDMGITSFHFDRPLLVEGIPQ